MVFGFEPGDSRSKYHAFNNYVILGRKCESLTCKKKKKLKLSKTETRSFPCNNCEEKYNTPFKHLDN